MKNYLIIGASSGIGEALTHSLPSDSRIYGTYHLHPKESNQEHISLHPLNVLDDTPDLSFLPDQLHGLAYCPGAINLKPFARISEESFLADYRLQVTGAVKLIQACLPRLRQSGAGSVLLFSTVAVQMGFPYHSIVSSSKGAVEGLCRALAAELAPAIRVNCIAPSITQTPLAQSILNSPEKTEANAQRHPLKKIGQPEDIARMAAYLLSSDSSWVTGQVFPIDGGMSRVR